MPDGQFPPSETEQFDLLQFLTGNLTGWGVFEDRLGRVKERFEISATGNWEGDAFVLDEHFTYASGKTEHRVWTLHPQSNGTFIGRCDDCKGEAVGRSIGDHATLDYTFLLKTSKRTLELTFNDRFYPIGETCVVNRTKVSKWGLKVGEISAVFCRN